MKYICAVLSLALFALVAAGKSILFIYINLIK